MDGAYARPSRQEVNFGKLLVAGQHSRVFIGEYRGESVALKVRQARKTEVAASAPEDGRYLDDGEAMAIERMLISEAEIRSHLPKHPHVVGFIGIVADDDPGGPILVLDLASRHSAAELFAGKVEERAQHSWVRTSDETQPPHFPDHGICLCMQAEIVRVVVEIAAAVEHLHGLSPPVIHVDLAARNVLVDVEGGRAWLADFALARELAHAPSKSGSPHSHESLPFRILAPEAQVEASNCGLSRASDVFAFGMLLYVLFSGAIPWGLQTAPAIAWKLTRGGLRPPLPPAPLLDSALSGLIQQCWRPDPALRPSMREVRLSLQAWLDRKGASPMAREPLGRTRAAAAAAFVSEAAAATIVRESQHGGLLEAIVLRSRMLEEACAPVEGHAPAVVISTAGDNCVGSASQPIADGVKRHADDVSAVVISAAGDCRMGPVVSSTESYTPPLVAYAARMTRSAHDRIESFDDSFDIAYRKCDAECVAAIAATVRACDARKAAMRAAWNTTRSSLISDAEDAEAAYRGVRASTSALVEARSRVCAHLPTCGVTLFPPCRPLVGWMMPNLSDRHLYCLLTMQLHAQQYRVVPPRRVFFCHLVRLNFAACARALIARRPTPSSSSR